MQNRGDKTDPQAMQEAMRLAGTPAGQQLLDLLQKSGGEELRQAMAKAAAGDYKQAKKTLSALLDDPEVKNLMHQLGR